MSDFGKECAEVWRNIKEDFKQKPVTDRSVREQINSDMDKNIERHEGPGAPKRWPIPAPADPPVDPAADWQPSTIAPKSGRA